jgi:ribose 5-phosphate isomerase B
MKKILIASDHAGFNLKGKLISYLAKRGLEARDLGANSAQRCDYPLLAAELAGRISAGRAKLGILICHTGIGNSIVANRFPGVRAALCYNLRAARLARQHNDSNVLVMGSYFISSALAKKITGVWLNTKFIGGRHRRRLNQVRKIEREIWGL